MRMNDFWILRFCNNLNLILQKLQSAKTGSKCTNFAILKLMLAAKPTIPHKMASFKMQKNDFYFFAKPNWQKFNIVRVKSRKNNFANLQIKRCIPTNWHMANTMAPSKRKKKVNF